MKKILKIVLFAFALFIVIIYLPLKKTGVWDRIRAEKRLESIYKREFKVINTYTKCNGQIWVEAYFEEFPNRIFKTAMKSDFSEMIDSYGIVPVNEYVLHGMEETIADDMESLFPGGYWRFSSASLTFADAAEYDCRLPYEQIVSMCSKNPIEDSALLMIFLPDEKTYGDYEDEYTFFTEKVNSFIAENKMMPIGVSIISVDNEELCEIRELSDEKLIDFDFREIYKDKHRVNAYFCEGLPSSVLSLEQYISARKDY